ncbi:MAG: glycosyltransferase, partial [Bacteroidia bacterium]
EVCENAKNILESLEKEKHNSKKNKEVSENKNTTNNKSLNKASYKGNLKWNEIESCLLNYDFFVLPTLHENFGHAIFESLAAGIPVLISDNTPWRKLQTYKIGWDLNLENKLEWINAFHFAIKMNNQKYSIYSQNCLKFANNWLYEQDLKNKYIQLFKI